MQEEPELVEQVQEEPEVLAGYAFVSSKVDGPSLRDCLEFLVRGGVPLLGGGRGLSVSDKVSERGGTKILR